MTTREGDIARLASWITKAITAPQPDGSPARVFKLSHLVEGSEKQKVVYETFYREGVSPESMATDIFEHGQGDANVAGGIQRYSVRAYYGQKTLEPRGGRYGLKFRAEPEEDTEEGEEGLDGAVTERTLLAQSYRHQEATTKALVMSVAQTTESFAGLFDRLASRLDRSEERSFLMLERLQESLDRRVERELSVRREIRSEERWDQAIEMVKRYAPIYLADQWGRGGSPVTALEMLADNLNENELQGIFNSLSPERQGLFLKIIQERAEQRKALEERQKKLETEAEKITPALAAIPPGGGDS